jgi:hypothetical protein
MQEKIILKWILKVDVAWFYKAQDVNQLWAVVNTVMDILFPQKVWNFYCLSNYQLLKKTARCG